jgi:glycosyltransferase involved in cell wall biosynthesis
MNPQIDPRITIIIPYYKNLVYLNLAIQSVQAQTCKSWKAIVLDDCGGEDAQSLVGSFKDNRFSYVRNEYNLGLAGNWNKGMDLAKTEFVTIFHADDMLMPNYVCEILRLMDEHPDASAGHCRSEIIDGDGKRCWSFVDEIKKGIRPKHKLDLVTAGDKGLSSLLNGSWIICPTICYRKNLISAHSFKSRWKFMVDIDFISEILMAGGAIVGSNAKAYRYRRHSGSQTTELTKSPVRFTEQFQFLSEINAKAHELNWGKCVLRSRRKTGLKAHLLFQAIIYVRHKEHRLASNAFMSAVVGKDCLTRP